MEVYQQSFKIALGYLREKDYGRALAETLIILGMASIEKKSFEAKVAKQLMSEIERHIENEFDKYATMLGLKVTAGNKRWLMREHSLHLVEYSKIIDKMNSEEGSKSFPEEFRARIYPLR